MSKPWKILSWNVNGIRAAEKKGLYKWILDESPDILCLQETKADEAQVPKSLTRIEGFEAFWMSAERKGYSGVGIYAKHKPLDVIMGIGKKEYDTEGRVLALEYPSFFIVNAYFPNAQEELKRLKYKLAFNKYFEKYLKNLKGPKVKEKGLIVCGDYNVAHKEIDIANPAANINNAGFSKPERDWMDGFISSGYVDTFREFNKEPGQYSWWTYRFGARARNIGWRIDYVCVNKDVKNKVRNGFIMKDVMGSDHCPVGILFDAG